MFLRTLEKKTLIIYIKISQIAKSIKCKSKHCIYLKNN